MDRERLFTQAVLLREKVDQNPGNADLQSEANVVAAFLYELDRERSA